MSSKDTPTTSLGGVIVGKSPATLESGAMHLGSQNMVLRETDKIESRRGLQYLYRSLRFDKLFAYSGSLLAHQFDADGGLLHLFTSGYGASTPLGMLTSPGQRKPQSASAGGRLFLTSASDGGPSSPGARGLRVLDSLVYPDVLRDGGGPIASSIYPGSGVTAVAGWLAAGYQVAYRYVLGYVTSAGVQVLGPPSGRALIANGGGGAFTVGAGWVLPPGLTDAHFIQIYRSSQVLSSIEPDDDLRLVYEKNLTSLECTNKLVSMSDVVPDDLRGEFLYTNPNSGEGIQQANDPPPLAEEVVLHKNRLWLGRTTQPYEFSFKIIAIGGAGGMANADRIIITSQSPALEVTAGTDFTVVTGGSASQNVVDTAQSLVRGINSLPANVSVWAEYLSTPDSSLGEIRIYERKPGSAGGAFLTYVDQRSGGAAWTMRSAFAPEFLPYLPGIGTALTFSLQRVANVVTATISSGNLTNALRVGDSVSIFNPSGTFGATVTTYVVTTVGATTFTYAETGANAGPTAGYVFNITTTNIAEATRESAINRVHFSKPFEYEAFPRGDYADIGASDKGIIAMRVTRETLWVFKEDGLFRITGDEPDTFDVERVDATTIAIAPECVQPFAESVVAWTTKGVVILSESTFDLISTDIDRLLLDYLATDAIRSSSYLPGCFILVDETEKLIRLHLKGSGADDTSPTPVTQGAGEAMVYSVETKTWHHWRYPYTAGSTYTKPLEHGLAEPTTRRIFYVDGYAHAGEGILWREWAISDSKLFSDDGYGGGGGGAERLALSRTALWVAQLDKAPMRDKRWDEVSVLLASLVDASGVITMPAVFTYGFGNENNEQGASMAFFGMVATKFTTAPNTAAPPTHNSVRIAVPIDFSRGQRLWVRVDNNTIDTAFTIHGFQVAAEVLNASITR